MGIRVGVLVCILLRCIWRNGSKLLAIGARGRGSEGRGGINRVRVTEQLGKAGICKHLGGLNWC
jgi:hypothetical protein